MAELAGRDSVLVPETERPRDCPPPAPAPPPEFRKAGWERTNNSTFNVHLLNVVLDVGGGVGRFPNKKQKGVGVRNNIREQSQCLHVCGPSS